MIKAGIVGGAGYTAGELIRILINHSEVEIGFIYSTSNAGNAVNSIHQDLVGSTNLKFTQNVDKNIDILFLCLGHGNSKNFLQQFTFAKHTKIIDLSNDFRLLKDAKFLGSNFVYGLPELQKNTIIDANYVANPGCFATAIQLALLPMAKMGILKNNLHINAVTGATGAGVSLSETSHFAWRDNNFSYYKPFTHQHLAEIKQTVIQLQDNFSSDIFFLPNRGNFSRGIFATIYFPFKGTIDEAKAHYFSYYKDHPFTHVSEQELHLKQVVNTNKCLLHLHKYNDQLLITSCIDNLIKGASGQAIQNMNLMFGLEEDEGLQLKGSNF